MINHDVKWCNTKRRFYGELGSMSKKGNFSEYPFSKNFGSILSENLLASKTQQRYPWSMACSVKFHCVRSESAIFIFGYILFNKFEF